MIKKIADLVQDKVITEVSDLADHSDRTGMRIQIELKRDAIPQVVLNKLYKHTGLQATFGYNAVALVDNVPKTLSLLELITHYLDFQRVIVTRRSKYDLRKAEDRAHVLAGYLIALDNLDEVIRVIRGADDTDAAREELMSQFSLSEIQATAILDLRLRALTGLERKRVEDEYADLQERIAELRSILGDPARIDALIREELLEIKSIYGKSDDRRTEIIAAEGEFSLEDMIAEEDMVIAITRSGYIKRLPVTSYREQRRGGVGVMGMDLKDEDYIEHLFVASTHDYVLFFTSVGKVYRLKVHELPLGSRQSKGRAIVNLLPFRQDESVRAVIATRDYKESKYLVFATKKGVVKKTEFLAYNTPLKADGIIAIKMREDDELIGVRLSDGDDDILMVSRGGQAIRFHESDVRAMGRDASGVRGMNLRSGDEVIEVNVAEDDADLLVVTENGYGKRTPSARVPGQGPRRARREDGSADRRQGQARRRSRCSRRLRGDADLDERHRDPDARRGRQAPRTLDAGSDRDAPSWRRRARFESRARGRERGLRLDGRGRGRRGCRGRDRAAGRAGLRRGRLPAGRGGRRLRARRVAPESLRFLLHSLPKAGKTVYIFLLRGRRTRR